MSVSSMVESVADFTRVADVPGVRLVGVDGPSGSGKSTFARPLSTRLDAPLIEVDDFVSWKSFAGWWPRFEDQVVRPLLAGQDAVYQQRDWQGDEFGDRLGSWKRVSWAPVVVIEGVTSTRRSISEHLACRVWVEAPAELRLQRGLARDGETHKALWQRWMAEEESFFAADEAALRADYRVSGTELNDSSAR